MSNWRALEAEIVRIARQHGLKLDETKLGDVIIDWDEDFPPFVNLTEFAQELDRAGVRVK